MPYYASDMSSGGQSDDLAAKAADAVRGIVREAEDRAAEIIRDADAKAAGIREQAEAEANRIRERAEADARGQIEAAKRALDELGGTLVAAASEAIPKTETPEPKSEPTPEPEPEPELKPELPAEPPGLPETPVSPPPANGDDAAERLVAMKLAVDGEDPAAIEAALVDKFGPGDRSELIKEILARVRR